MTDDHRLPFSVDIPQSIEPAPPDYPADPFAGGRQEYRVIFRGGTSLRIVSGEKAVGWLRVLQATQRSSRPVAVASDDGVLSELRLPAVVSLTKLVATREGDLELHAYPSHVRHLLPRGHPEFGRLSRQIAEWLDPPVPVAIIEDDRHDIIDILAYRPPPDGPDVLPRLPPFWDRLRYLIDIWWRWWLEKWRWLCWIFCWGCRCTSQARAWQLYHLVAAKSCAPLNPQPPCIPFLYPDNGCWGRAHEMCRLMVAEGVTPAKVWIHGNLHTLTRNNPNCYVNWGWHVAPTLCVRNGFCFTETWVIDPSLFPGPVTKATWKSVQGDPSATLNDTSWTIFHWWGNQTDPTFTQTNTVLSDHRTLLLYRSTVETDPNTGQLWGPPPYAHCP